MQACRLDLSYLQCSVLASDNGLSLQSCSPEGDFTVGHPSSRSGKVLHERAALPLEPSYVQISVTETTPNGDRNEAINTDARTRIHRTPVYQTPECLVRSSQEQL